MKVVVAFIGFFCLFTDALYTGNFLSDTWVLDNVGFRDVNVKFIVALKLRNVDQMQQEFLTVSNPASASYGKYLQLPELSKKYGATTDTKEKVASYFKNKIEGATVEYSEFGDFISVTASIPAIENGLATTLDWYSDSKNRIDRKSIRSSASIYVPSELSDLISFISLNSPINLLAPRAAKSLELKATKNNLTPPFNSSVSVTTGNQEALISFQVHCGDGSLNVYNPPCANLDDNNFIPSSFAVTLTSYSIYQKNPLPLDTDPTVFTIQPSKVYCYNYFTLHSCSGIDGYNCTCTIKLSPVPKYTQLRVNVSTLYPTDATSPELASNLFALTDTATAAFLSDLYNIPPALTVKHGSNQSVAEFYDEFYSNSDLAAFLKLSGLPNASIPESNVYGDLFNDQTDPGGEAQLDVEYIMALAPGAETFFYSMADYNPNDPVNTTINEGFLEYLLVVNNQTNPPWVHSLSYGDVEADIFNASHNGSVAYGRRCDEEFMKMGLRGLTVVFSSGDDGIGNSIIRDDPVTACTQAWPAWPASSPYVTSVGATQMTNQYLPICGQNYAVKSYVPSVDRLTVQCTDTGETVCSSTFGGIITSGGGFSDVNDRLNSAPWQDAAVKVYLESSNSDAYPPLSYFNSQGRGYPDVATYGSNYFVYLNGKITRESGTSASAPVFAAMVTLWNDIRLAYNKPTLGFIAPFLYSIYATHPEAFQDVVTGNNACGVGYSIETVNCCEYSFAASSGWDAVTGLGSPNFNIIADLVLNNATTFTYIDVPNTESVTNVYSTTTTDNTDSTTARRANVANVVAIFALMIGLLALFMSVFIYWKSGLAALLSREVGGTGRTHSNQQWVSPLINSPEE